MQGNTSCLSASHAHLKFTRLGNILDTFEWLILFAIHIETIDLQSRNSQLCDCKLHINRGIGIDIRAAGCN